MNAIAAIVQEGIVCQLDGLHWLPDDERRGSGAQFGRQGSMQAPMLL